MIITFEERSLEILFSDFDLISKKIGFEMAKGIKKRYDQLAAYPNIGCLLQNGVGKPEILQKDLAGHISLHVTNNYRLILRIPDFERIKADMGEINSTKNIIIKGVYDYHGSKKERLL